MAHNFKDFPELTNNQMQFYYFDSPHKQVTEGFTAKVVRVIDGDTIKVRTDFRDFDFNIRLAYIQAPELKQSGGIEAKNQLENMIDEEVFIDINFKNRVGKWGRLIGNVISGGQSMSQAMLDTNFEVVRI